MRSSPEQGRAAGIKRAARARKARCFIAEQLPQLARRKFTIGTRLRTAMDSEHLVCDPIGDETKNGLSRVGGVRSLVPAMWERARELVDEAVAVSLEETAEAVRLLASRAHVVAEGAGALALAAALKRDDRCVCIVSGGNIDAAVLAWVLTGESG